MEKESLLFLGETTFRNQRKKIGIKIDDRRRHFYAIGKTGMGKSSLLENMAIQDINSGHGLAFIDPHGDVAEDLLDYIPENRIKDVIYFNPADIDYPIAFNAIEKISFEYRHLVANNLMSIFKKLWPDVWSPRMEYILNNTILALLEYPHSTILLVNRMLSDPFFRDKVLTQVTDPVIKAFWKQEFSRYTQRYELEATAAIQNKVGQFISNPLIRNIVGQIKTKINMREIMDKKKILIVNISKGKIGEDNSRLLGALIITKLQMAAMSRVDTPEEERSDFFLYVDEFQNFATESFTNILSEARKYRLSLILANQYLSQLDEMTVTGGKNTKVRNAVFGNVGTIAIFRVGAEDAEILAEEFLGTFTIEDFVNLPKYNLYIKLMIDGVSQRPFSAETLPLPKKLSVTNKEKIIEFSRQQYGTEKKNIDAEIEEALDSNILSVKSDQTKIISEEKKPNINDKKFFHIAPCIACGKPVKLIFPPDQSRKIYCEDCAQKNKEMEKEKAQISLKDLTESSEKIISFSKKDPLKSQINIEELKKTLREKINKDKKNE